MRVCFGRRCLHVNMYRARYRGENYDRIHTQSCPAVSRTPGLTNVVYPFVLSQHRRSWRRVQYSKRTIHHAGTARTAGYYDRASCAQHIPRVVVLPESAQTGFQFGCVLLHGNSNSNASILLRLGPRYTESGSRRFVLDSRCEKHHHTISANTSFWEI